jgi:hypothetical protein
MSAIPEESNPHGGDLKETPNKSAAALVSLRMTLVKNPTAAYGD